jgi:hypothetical protein
MSGLRQLMALDLATANKMNFENSKSVFLDGFAQSLLFWQRPCCIGFAYGEVCEQRPCYIGFAYGEYLSFASPKERYQRKGDPGSLESPQ